MKPLLILIMALLLTAGAAAQHEAQGIQVVNPWSRALPPVSTNGAAYLTLLNSRHHSDELVGASSPIAQRVELHTHSMEGGVMKMRPVSSVELPPGKKVELKPGALHLMLIGLKYPLEEGDHFPLTLQFAHASPIKVEVVVLATGAAGPITIEQQAKRQNNPAHDKSLNMPAAQPLTLAVTIEDTPAGGFVLMLDTARFHFTREHADGPHVPGEKYAQLYVDGKKIDRIYAPRYELKPLTPGVHDIEVGLYSNDHMIHTADGKPVSGRFVMLVSKSYHRSKDAQLQRVDLAIERGKVNVKEKTIRVAEGDVVELRWSSDVKQTLHLHGYDIEAEVRPNSPVVMRFDAFATGRFPVEIHGGSHTGGHGQPVLLYLEVRPR